MRNKTETDWGINLKLDNIDEPLTRIKGTTIRHYVTDALGSVIGLADDTGAMKTTYTYDPFGNTTISGEASDNPFQYTGRENDGTGLYYYRARYYSPDLQRFISEDPIGLKGGDVNFYAYVGNNPLRYTDPLGLCREKCEDKCDEICPNIYGLLCNICYKIPPSPARVLCLLHCNLVKAPWTCALICKGICGNQPDCKKDDKCK